MRIKDAYRAGLASVQNKKEESVGTAGKSVKRLEKLRAGHPTSSGKILNPKTGKPVSERTKVSAKDMSQIKERHRAEKLEEGNVRRGGK